MKLLIRRDELTQFQWMGQVELEGQPKARRGKHMLAYRKVGIVGRSWFCLEGNRSCALFVFFPLDFSFYNLVLQFRDGVGWIDDLWHAILV